MSETEKILSHCNECGGGQRNHVVIKKHEVVVPQFCNKGQFAFDEEHTHYLLFCAGCDQVKYRLDSEVSMFPAMGIITEHYPSALKRNLPDWVKSLQIGSVHFIQRFLKQIYSSYQTGSYDLCAMGIRALIEQAMIDKVGDLRSFAENIKAFEAEGYISNRQKESLDAALNLGHAAIHRGYAPTAEDIRRALDIVEPILETIYAHEANASALAENVPSRPKKQAKEVKAEGKS